MWSSPDPILTGSMILSLLGDMPDWRSLTLVCDCANATPDAARLLVRQLQRLLPTRQSCLSEGAASRPNVLMLVGDPQVPAEADLLPAASPAVLVFPSGLGAAWNSTFCEMNEEIYFMDVPARSLVERYRIKHTEVKRNITCRIKITTLFSPIKHLESPSSLLGLLGISLGP